MAKYSPAPSKPTDFNIDDLILQSIQEQQGLVRQKNELGTAFKGYKEAYEHQGGSNMPLIESENSLKFQGKYYDESGGLLSPLGDVLEYNNYERRLRPVEMPKVDPEMLEMLQEKAFQEGLFRYKTMQPEMFTQSMPGLLDEYYN
tara:strand:- start:284 stop:718 length:435 start_codon:yes stop_codon:yes gene_type:complete